MRAELKNKKIHDIVNIELPLNDTDGKPIIYLVNKASENHFQYLSFISE